MRNFLKKLDIYHKYKNYNYDIFIVCDDESKKYNSSKHFKIIQLSHEMCTKKGYKDSLLRYYHAKNIKHKSFSLDKALFYFSLHNNYDHYWLIEDDIFIPTVEIISNIDKKHKNCDLLVNSNSIQQDFSVEWHWALMAKNNKNRKCKIRQNKAKTTENFYIEPPWYSSYCSIVRISNNLLKKIKKFVNKNKTLIFMEFMFNTIAMKNNLQVCVIGDYLNIHWQKEPSSEEITSQKLFHPIKDYKKHKKYRLGFKNIHFLNS